MDHPPTTQAAEHDEVMPDGPWAFDETVTTVFDDMLSRSIPEYQSMRSLVSDLAVRSLAPGDTILDIGCSRGEALARVLAHPLCPTDVRAVGLEASEPMIDAAREHFDHDPRVDIRRHDLRAGLPVDVRDCGVVLAVLTVMFVPIQYRLALVNAAAKALRPGGRLILVEKVLGSSAAIDDELVSVYHEMKARHGYTAEQIDRKRLALEGVQVPVTAGWNEDTLRRAGFDEFECVWRWANFAAWVAYR